MKETERGVKQFRLTHQIWPISRCATGGDACEASLREEAGQAYGVPPSSGKGRSVRGLGHIYIYIYIYIYTFGIFLGKTSFDPIPY